MFLNSVRGEVYIVGFPSNLMDSVGKVVEKLRKMKQLRNVIVPTDEELKAFFETEASIGTQSGMPMINASLRESMKRKHHLVLAQSDAIEHTPHHLMTMIAPDGTTVGFDVPKGLEYEVEGREDLVWLSEDFVLDPNGSIGEVTVVMHPYPVSILGAEEGVKDAVLMFPAPSVDIMIRDTYNIGRSVEYSTAILSFDEL